MSDEKTVVVGSKEHHDQLRSKIDDQMMEAINRLNASVAFSDDQEGVLDDILCNIRNSIVTAIGTGQ